jgi:beta-phosphoglucomutase
MINCVLFDMDGVLVDACEWHRKALNKALVQHGYPEISLSDHYHKYNGLPTRVKLKLMGIDERMAGKIEYDKQVNTLKIIDEECYPQDNVMDTLKYLNGLNIKTGCVTNSISETTHKILDKTELLPYLDVVITNTDVKYNKPSPDCYLLACQKLKVNPSNTLVVEDSPKGIQAGIDSGCKVRVLFSIEDLTPEFIQQELEKY